MMNRIGISREEEEAGDFFGFDTAMPDDDFGEVQDLHEEVDDCELDALNEETFGTKAQQGDWETLHEEFAIVDSKLGQQADESMEKRLEKMGIAMAKMAEPSESPSNFLHNGSSPSIWAPLPVDNLSPVESTSQSRRRRQENGRFPQINDPAIISSIPTVSSQGPSNLPQHFEGLMVSPISAMPKLPPGLPITASPKTHVPGVTRLEDLEEKIQEESDNQMTAALQSLLGVQTPVSSPIRSQPLQDILGIQSGHQQQQQQQQKEPHRQQQLRQQQQQEPHHQQQQQHEPHRQQQQQEPHHQQQQQQEPHRQQQLQQQQQQEPHHQQQQQQAPHHQQQQQQLQQQEPHRQQQQQQEPHLQQQEHQQQRQQDHPEQHQTNHEQQLHRPQLQQQHQKNHEQPHQQLLPQHQQQHSRHDQQPSAQELQNILRIQQQQHEKQQQHLQHQRHLPPHILRTLPMPIPPPMILANLSPQQRHAMMQHYAVQQHQRDQQCMHMEQQRRHQEAVQHHQERLRQESAAHARAQLHPSPLMTDKDKAFVVKVQLVQLKINDPYEDDYYYTMYNLRKVREVLKDKGITSSVNEDLACVIPHLGKGHWVEKPLSLNQYQGALGKLRSGSIHKPKKMLDAGESLSVEAKKELGTKRYRDILRHIENLYPLLYGVEDMDIKARVSGSKISPEVSLEKLVRLFHGLCLDEADGDIFRRIMSVRKGKTLVIRIFPYLTLDMLCNVFEAITRHLGFILKQDAKDNVLSSREVFNAFEKVVTNIDSEKFIGLLEVLKFEDASVKSNVAVALRSTSGMSFVLLFLRRARENEESDVCRKFCQQLQDVTLSLPSDFDFSDILKNSALAVDACAAGASS